MPLEVRASPIGIQRLKEGGMGMQGEVPPMLVAPAFVEALLPGEIPEDPVLRSFLVSIQVLATKCAREKETSHYGRCCAWHDHAVRRHFVSG